MKIRNAILLAFSLIFYAWGEPVWISLLVFSALIDFANGIFIEKYRGKPLAKLGIVSTLFFNLGLLMTFKYSDFIIENVNYLFSSNFPKPGFLLPIGISFYTFQTISYTIDVYKGEVKAARSFADFLMFVSLYHQLVAGPIVRYSHIADEIQNRVFSWSDFSSGVTRFCKGLFKKVFIANVAGDICSRLLGQDDLAGLSVAGGWYGIVLYSLQIYFDFSGYSDMAIGLGRMFGFHYHENFNHPYISKSITDFWRRWHISLSTFFRDYLYIPMGGNRHHQIRNILVVWGLTGLWHGASWNFVLWGIYFGLILVLEKQFILKWLDKAPVYVKHIYAIPLIVFGWAIFYFTDFSQLRAFSSIILGLSNHPLMHIEDRILFMNNLIWFTLAITLCMPVYNTIQKKISDSRLLVTYQDSFSLVLNIGFLFVSVALLVGSSYNPFLYFRF